MLHVEEKLFTKSTIIQDYQFFEYYLLQIGIIEILNCAISFSEKWFYHTDLSNIEYMSIAVVNGLVMKYLSKTLIM